MTNQFSAASDVKRFMLAGNARVTLVSEKTGARFTYRVRQPEPGVPHFVSLLSGPDNDADFQFLGTIFIDGIYCHSRKSRIGTDAPSARAFAYAWGHLSRGQLPPACEIYHEGRCGRCGRALTVPESIESGLGPVCAARLG